MKSDIEINWLLNIYCNYECRYCYCRGIDKKKAFRGIPDVQKVVQGFDRLGLNCLVYMSGGEPFFQPGFIELCQGLTKNHYISLNSNLSHKKVYEFADTLDPARVRCVHASVHIEEMENLGIVDDFIKKYKYLEDRGFYVFASYVLYPPFLPRFERDYEFFKSAGILLRPKLFRGPYTRWQIPYYKGIGRKLNLLLERLFAKQYPQDFSDREKEQILEYINRSQEEGQFVKVEELADEEDRMSDVWQDRKFIDGLPAFKGKLCGAGKTFVRLTEKGDLFRCHSDNEYLGNLYDGDVKLHDSPKPCRVNVCQCAYIGYRHVLPEQESEVL